MNRYRLLSIFVGAMWCASAVAREAPKIEPLLPEVAPVKALAIRPSGDRDRHELFVADREGRILRVASDSLDTPEVVVAGNGSAAAAIQFINGKTFVVASGNSPPQLRAYEILDDGKPLAAEQTKSDVRVAAGIDGEATAIALGPMALYAVGATDGAGWLLRSRVRSGVPGQLKPFANVGTRPTCVAISTRGWVVVSDAGGADETEDSRLTFLHPSDTDVEPVLEIELKLLDVTAMAYSPRESLYAADLAEAEPDRGGIYRIDMDYEENRIGGKAVRVLSVENPTAMTFAPDGTLYIIARNGKLWRAIGLE